MALRLATRQARLVVFGYNAVTSRIEWVRSPASPQYAGSPLSLAGGQVMAYYKDGTASDITASCGYDPDEGSLLEYAGELNINATYTDHAGNEFTADTQIDVADAEELFFTRISNPTQKEGAGLDLSGAVLSIRYTDGTTRPVAASAVTFEPAPGEVIGHMDSIAVQAVWRNPATGSEYTAEYKSNPYNYTSDDESANRQAAKDSAKKIAKLMYKPCIGVKTGYSSTAGDCFAGFAKKGNTEIIAVVLNAPHTKEKFQDAKKLWVYGYDNFKTYTAQEKEDFEFDLDLKRGELREVAVGIKEDLKVTALKKDKPSQTVTTQIELFDEKPYAPIKKGAVVGKLVAYDNGVKVGSQDMVSLETSGKGGILSYIGVADEDRAEFFVLLALFIALIYVISQRRKKAKARKRRRQRSQVK